MDVSRDFFDEQVSRDEKSDPERLRSGEVPSKIETVREISAGIDALSGFMKDQYFLDYIPDGGSKIKFVTGRFGAGKTHFLRLLLDDAANAGFLTVSISARTVWMHDFKEIYLEILRQCDIHRVIRGCAREIIREMDYDPDQIEEGKTFMDFLYDRQEGDALSKSTIREALRERFTRNPRLDHNFALCCMLLTGSVLGHPVLEEGASQVLISYLNGDKTVKLSQLRQLGLVPARITKYNARHMLRSLSEVVHLAGFAGICVAVDDMEILLNRAGTGQIRYTKLRRDDTYESIRQLIDDIDSMRYILFAFAFDRELIDNENYGIKSYQALWMRIQNEVQSSRFNRFADIIDLDHFADQFYTPQILVEMSEKLVRYFRGDADLFAGSVDAGASEVFKTVAAESLGFVDLEPVDEQTALELIERTEYGNLGLPYLVNHAVFHPQRDKEGTENV